MTEMDLSVTLTTEEGLLPLRRLSKDLRAAATTLSTAEARYLVDLYYMIQEDRKRLGNQGKAMDRSEQPEPHSVLDWFYDNVETLEEDIRRALDTYSAAQTAGQWMRSIVGIGPVIAAGLLAHIDVEHCPTAGHLWRFAGLDPTVEWLGTERAGAMVKAVVGGGAVTANHLVVIADQTNRKISSIAKLAADHKSGKVTPTSLASGLAKRPWNASLKTLCWKIGESFTKVSGREDAVYGQVYLQRKRLEWERNLRGLFADQAAAALVKKNFGRDTQARPFYTGAYRLPESPPLLELLELALGGIDGVAKLKTLLLITPEGQGQPMLPPAHIHARAKRFAVKLFLSHVQHVLYEDHFGEPPPKPYILTQPGHLHFVKPPNWPMS